MNKPDNGLTGAVRMQWSSIYVDGVATPPPLTAKQVVAVYIAGEALGSFLQIGIADKLGRIRFMQLSCIIVTVGCAIQAGSINIGMLLAGRCLAGVAVG